MQDSPKRTCEDLLALVQHIKTSMASIAERHGLTNMQLYVMHFIDNGHTTMGKVASNLHCDASNITGIIDRLVAQGLVSRQESENDRRAKMLQLTAKGKRLIGTIDEELPAAVGADRLNVWERSALRDLIGRIL